MTMKKFLSQALFIVSLFAIVGCDTNMPEPVPADSVPAGTSDEIVGTPHVTEAEDEAGSPSIEEQMDGLRENNGDIPQEERDRLNNVPVIPDVFDK